MIEQADPYVKKLELEVPDKSDELLEDLKYETPAQKHQTVDKYRRSVQINGGVYTSLSVILCGITTYNSQSLYILIFFGVPVLYHIISYVKVLLAINKWKAIEFNVAQNISCANFLYACKVYNPKEKSIIRYMSTKFWLLFFFVLVWQKPLNSFIDLTGPPTNSSSCTKVNSGGEELVFNPMGFFDYYKEYTETAPWKFCAMDQSWAAPNIHGFVYGYPTSPIIEQNVNEGVCDNPNVIYPGDDKIINGFVDTFYCPDSYPNLAYGAAADLPITPESQYIPYLLCPGNHLSNICISEDNTYAYYPATGQSCPGRHVPGAPKKICPVCLNYWRQMSNDHFGPNGYEHCEPYDENLAQSPFIICMFCPGRGFGWLGDEKYDYTSMLVQLILTSILMSLPLLEYITLIITFEQVRRSLYNDKNIKSNE